MRRATFLGALVAVFVVAGEGSAQSVPPPPAGVGQIDQYIEVIPTAQGGIPTSVRKQGRKSRQSERLAPKARREVETKGGADADVLTEIASSAVSGAESQAKPRPRKGTESQAKPRPPKPRVRPAPRTDALELVDGVRIAVSATTGRERLVSIGLLLVFLTAILVSASRARLRASSRL